MYRKFHGKKVAIDASVGLHTFAFVKARELTADDNDTSPFVDMFVARLKRHAREGIFPIVVFDGPPAPSNAATKQARAQRRECARERVKQTLASEGIEGRPTPRCASSCLH